MFKRLIAILLVASMLYMAACSSTPTTTDEGTSDTGTAAESGDSATDETSYPMENTLPIADGLELELFTGINARQNLQTLSEHSVVQEIERQTGITFKFIHPPAGDDGSYFNTTLASGQYPDLMYTGLFSTYPGGVEGAIQDNILINTDELIEQYAPNFLALVEDYGGEIDRWIRNDEGSIVKFGTMFLPPFVDGRAHNGLIARQDLLDEFGLDAPVTLDDYTEVLTAFRDNGVEIPIALSKFDDFSISSVNPIASAFGVAYNDFLIDETGNVNYSRVMPEYKEFLEFMNGWYNEGFFTRDLISRTASDTYTLFYNGTAGIVAGHSQTVKQSLTLGKEVDPDFAIVGLQFPRQNEDDFINLTRQALSVNANAWYITTDCEHPVEATKFVDYLYMEDTRLLTAWGLGNEEFPTYDVLDDGSRVFSDFIQNNSEMDMVTARSLYTLGEFPVMYDDMMERSQYNLPENIQVWDAWLDGSDSSGKMPHVMTLTLDESREYTEIKTKMDNYASEMVYKYVFGEESLDSFDDFVAELNDLGAQRAIEIQQAAYDRFMSR